MFATHTFKYGEITYYLYAFVELHLHMNYVTNPNAGAMLWVYCPNCATYNYSFQMMRNESRNEITVCDSCYCHCSKTELK